MKIELTLDETNKVLSALGKQPYVEVSELIEKIVSQVQPQMKSQTEEAQIVEETDEQV